MCVFSLSLGMRVVSRLLLAFPLSPAQRNRKQSNTNDNMEDKEEEVQDDADSSHVILTSK